MDQAAFKIISTVGDEEEEGACGCPRWERDLARWALRCTDSAILAEIAEGCRCGCVHNVLALGEVARAPRAEGVRLYGAP